tara:strand:+ start:560 stop:985 length:426 start_codon:yes stop_codon:yes gene_type:complete
MNEDDITFLEKSLQNNNNKNISSLTFSDINKDKKNIINDLNLTKKESKKILDKLSEYRYIDEIPDLVEGRYIRWINLKNPYDIKLTNGGILCEIKMEDYVSLVMKNNMNRLFQINLDENLIFQRLTEQEKIILYAIDVVNN